MVCILIPQGVEVKNLEAVDHDGDGVLDAVLTVDEGLYFYLNGDGLLLGTAASDAYLGAYGDDPPEISIWLLHKGPNGRWETGPVPTLDGE